MIYYAVHSLGIHFWYYEKAAQAFKLTILVLAFAATLFAIWYAAAMERTNRHWRKNISYYCKWDIFVFALFNYICSSPLLSLETCLSRPFITYPTCLAYLACLACLIKLIPIILMLFNLAYLTYFMFLSWLIFLI